MPKYIIEVPHEQDLIACAQVIESFLNYGSHFATKADWGCKDGVHKAWITVEADNREDARNILPPAYRAQATIVQLNKFSMAEVDEILEQHGKK
jgi:nicotinate-nucleotide pyrophosphorylase